MFVQANLSWRTWAVAAIVVLLALGVLVERRLTAAVAPLPQPLDRVPSVQKLVALTINVDWGEEFLPGILTALDQGGGRATFFITGRWAKAHPDLVRQIAQQGHQIENHGYSHPHPDRLSVSANLEEIKKAESVLRALTGRKPRFYAPPYGEKGPAGLRAAHQLGYQTVLWTLDTVDWRPESTPELIAQRVLNPGSRFGVKPDKRGAIVLMHPKENTVKALPVILKQLEREGFRCVTLDELITLSQAGNTTP